nr:phage tail tape measure protein [uncultured Solibaculum sp.]
MAYDGSLTFDTSINGDGFKTGLSKLGGVAKTGLKAAGVALGTVTAGLAAAGTASIKLGSDFESAMSRVKAISGATEDEFKKLNDQAKQLGADTSFSASQAAEGMENLASAGFTVEEITAAMPGLLDLAAASGEDLAASSEIAASAIRSFGLEASDAGHVADVLAANANMTNAAVVDTGYAFKYVAPIAKSLGISMEETAASIGILSNAGIKGEQAGTVLRGAMTRLVKPTEAAANAAEALGVSFFDSSGTMKPLSTIIGDLQKSTANLSDEQKNAYLSTIFGTEALSGMLALIDAGPEQLTELTQAYETCDGAAANAAATMQDNLKGAIEGLSGSAESLGITIYESMAEPLKEAAKQGTDYVNQLTKAFQRGGFEELIEEAGSIFAELATKAAENAPKMIDAAAGFINAFANGIKDHSAELVSAAGNIAKALANGLIKLLPREIQTPLKKMVRDISRSLTNGGLQKAIQTIIKTFQNLIKTVSNIADKIMPAFTKTVDFLGEHLDKVIPIVVGLKTALVTYKVTMKAVEAATKIATKVQEAYRNATNLAAAAQGLLNGALKVSPIGLVTSAIGFLVSGLLTYNMTAGDVKDTTESAGVEFEEMAEHLGSFEDGIANADSMLDEFNENLIVPEEQQAAIEQGMEDVQTQITKIAEEFAADRNSITDGEIQRLQDLLGQMQELSQQQLELSQGTQDAVKMRAEEMMRQGDLTEEAGNRIIKSAREARDKVIETADEQYNTQLQLAEKFKDSDVELYNQMKNEAYAAWKETIDGANETYAETARIGQEGHSKELIAAKQHISQLESIQSERVRLEESKNAELNRLQAQYDEDYKKHAGNASELAALDERLKQDKLKTEERFNARIKELTDEEDRMWDKNTAEYQASLLEQVAYAELYGTQIDDTTWQMAQNILNNWANIPEDSRAKVKELMQGWVDEMQTNEPVLFEQASGTTGGFVNSVITALETGTPGVITASSNLMSSVGSEAQSSGQTEGTATGDAYISGTVDAIESGSGEVSAATEGVLDDAGSNADQKGEEKYSGAASNAMSAYSSTMDRESGSVSSTASSIMSKIGDTASTTSSDSFFSAATNAMTSFSNALWAELEHVKNNVAQVISEIAWKATREGSTDFRIAGESAATAWYTAVRDGLSSKRSSIASLTTLPNSATTRSLVAKMKSAVLAEQARTSSAILGAASYHTTMSTRSSSYSDNRRTSTVNIYQPVKSPSELERILRKTDKELANGF